MGNTQDTSSGKMSREHSPQTKAKTSVRSLRRSHPSLRKFPRCLCLRRVDGHTLMCSWETDGALRTELLTLNTGEYPSVDAESTLSQILEVNVPKKYYLSQKACQGILRRAAARGKVLPEILKVALEKQAQSV